MIIVITNIITVAAAAAAAARTRVYTRAIGEKENRIPCESLACDKSIR